MKHFGKLCILSVLALITSSFAWAQQDTLPDPLYSYIPGFPTVGSPQTLTFDEEFLFGVPNGPVSGESGTGNWMAGMNGIYPLGGFVRWDASNNYWYSGYTENTPSFSEPATGIWEIPASTDLVGPFYMTNQDPFPTPSSPVYLEAHFSYANQEPSGEGLVVVNSSNLTAPVNGTYWDPLQGAILQVWNDSSIYGFTVSFFGTLYQLGNDYGFSQSGSDILLRLSITPEGSYYQYNLAVTDNNGHVFTPPSAVNNTGLPNMIWIGNPRPNPNYPDGAWTSFVLHHIRVWN
jgi:hypothetical protein